MLTPPRQALEYRPGMRTALTILCWFALALMLSTAKAESAVSEYRPGGLTPSEIGPALSYRPHDVDTCAALTGSGPNGEVEGKTETEARAGTVLHLLKVLTRSRAARAIMASAVRTRARRRPLHVCLDQETDLLAYYFSGLDIIGLNASLTEGGQVAFLAHELGHVLQHPRYSDNRYYPPEDLFLLRRVREAAAEAIAVRIAWELRAAGYPDAWGEKMAGPYADIVRAFGDAARHDATATGLMSATRAAFDRWFTAAWRRDAYDRMTVEHLQRISGDRTGLVPPRRRIRERFLRGIAALNGRNFLIETGGPALSDPYYAGGVSEENTSRLHRVLRDAELTAPAGGPNAMDGAAN